LGNLTVGRTWQEKVVLSGNFTIDSPIVVWGYTHLLLIGQVYLASGSECNLLQNKHPETNDVYCTIEGGVWYGNKLGQASHGHGIFWNHSTNPSGVEGWKLNVFRDLTILHCEESGLFVDSQGSAGSIWKFEDIAVGHCLDYGIYIRYVADAMFTRCFHLSAYTYSFYAVWSGTLFMEQMYFDSQPVKLEDVCLVYMNNFVIDAGDNDGPRLILEHCHHGKFSNGILKTDGDGASLYSAISLEGNGNGDSHRNLFKNLECGRVTGTGTRQFVYAINETDSDQNWNVYSNIDGADCSTACLRVLGANSTYCNSTILGDIVTS